jgi:ABC-type spermidine/putrescine transport system permease subunit II
MWARRITVRGIGRRLIHIYSLIVAILLVYPTIQLFIVAVSDDIVFPPRYFSLQPFFELGASFLGTIPFSVALGVSTTLVLIALCLPMAYAMERIPFRGRNVMGVAIFLPFILPGVGYMVALGAAYILLFPELIGSFIGVLIPVVIGNLVWMSRAVQGSLATSDASYEDAAVMLGASRLRAFRSITLPQIAPGIAVGSMIVFANSTTAFVAPYFLGRPDSVTATVNIFNELTLRGLDPRVAAQSLLVELVVMSLVVIGYLFSRKRFRGLII